MALFKQQDFARSQSKPASKGSFDCCSIHEVIYSLRSCSQARLNAEMYPGVSEKCISGLNSLLSQLNRYWYRDGELSQNTYSQWPEWLMGIKEWKPLSLKIFLLVIWYGALVITSSRQRGTGGAKSRNSVGELNVTDKKNMTITVPAKWFGFTTVNDNWEGDM